MHLFTIFLAIFSPGILVLAQDDPSTILVVAAYSDQTCNNYVGAWNVSYQQAGRCQGMGNVTSWQVLSVFYECYG
jgi:hypothetical protein